MTDIALSMEITDLKEETERATCKRLAAKVGLFVKHHWTMKEPQYDH